MHHEFIATYHFCYSPLARAQSHDQPPPPSQRESGKHHEASVQEVERTGFVIIELSFALFWYISSSTGTLNLSLRIRDDRK